jgi:peptidyl-tRNA hydrolase, PTH1 family
LATELEGIRLIIGLGNPGPRYAETRHNVGAWLINHLAEKENQTWQYSSKFHGNYCKIKRNDHNVILFNPDTFMNCSGQAVLAIAHFYRILPQQILIAHDELDFPSGKIRLKSGGGHGGHNGLRDTVNKLGSSDFMRIRIGIGHPGNKHQVSDYVLKKPSSDDLILIDQSLEKALSVIDLLIAGKVEKAFLTLHSEI